VTKILVVDDQTSVRMFLKAVLTGMGFEVLEADDGDTALAEFMREPEIALVVMDLKMQRMHGKEACARIRQMNPGLPIIISSSYVSSEDESELAGLGINSILRKPFPKAQLESAIKEAIHA
jgi:CheY-like chemotaxis protein